MLKHRVQHPPPAAASHADSQNLTDPPDSTPRSGIPEQQAQSRSGNVTQHTKPGSGIPRQQAHPRSGTPTQQTQSRHESPSHGRTQVDSPKHVRHHKTMFCSEPQTLAEQPRSDSLSMQTSSEKLNIRDTRSGSFSMHVPQSRSEYSMTSNHTALGEGMSMSSSYDAKEGVRRINEKYDSIGNLTVSPYRSSVGSPGMDGLQFNFTDIITSQKFREGITEQDLLQIETFYKSHKSEVYVCGCLANMYFGSMKSTISNDQWTFSNTGIPLLLLDTGEHRRERKLFIIIAEKGTGFTLWRDVIDKMTGYRTPNPNFHTMRTSSDHSRVAGFSFDDANAATEFYSHIDRLTADPNDELLTLGKIKKKKSIKDKMKKIKLPKKSEISQPCCFVHVTKLDKPSLAICSDDEHRHHHQQQQHQQQQDQQVEHEDGSEYISQPFNFQNITGKYVAEDDVTSGDISNMVESKATIDSSDAGSQEKS